MQFTTTSQQALNNGIKVCAYGRAGAGKTKLIETAPAPIILSAEGGTLSIAKANIPVIIVSSMKDLEEAYQWLVMAPESRNFQTVCLDSISEIAETCLTGEKAKTKDPRKAYGEMQDAVAVQIRLFRDLKGKNVYFTAKAELKETPDGGKMYGASMPGQKTGQGLPYFFDEFFYLGVGEVPDPHKPGEKINYRYLLTQQDSQYEAKDRSGALAAIEKPDLSYIFDKIRAFHQVAPA